LKKGACTRETKRFQDDAIRKEIKGRGGRRGGCHGEEHFAQPIELGTLPFDDLQLVQHLRVDRQQGLHTAMGDDQAPFQSLGVNELQDEECSGVTSMLPKMPEISLSEHKAL